MPYTVDSEDLPKHVQDMPDDKREQWVKVFNEAFEDCMDYDGESSNCDGEAMRIANASVSERLRTWINKLLVFLGFEKPVKERAVALGHVIDQVYADIAEMLEDEYAWINDVYLDGGGTFLLCSSKGKLYRFRVDVSDANEVSIGEPEEVVVDIQPAADANMARMVIRQEGERWRWLSISSVSVLNRNGEIDSTALYDSFIDYAERTGEYPIRQFYHAGEVFRTGEADFLARVGYALITSGLYDDTDLARAEVAARQAEPVYWGDSIGFLAEQPEMLEVQSGISVPIYKVGILREISTLPEQDACAWFTNLTNVEVTRMNDKQFAAFVKLFGGDEAKARQWLEDNPEALNRQIVDAGMLARSQETVTDETPDPTPEEPPAPMQERTVEMDETTLQMIVDRAVGQMEDNISGLADSLQTIQVNWETSVDEITRKLDELTKALESHSTRLGGLEADKAAADATRVMDLPQSKVTVTYRPRNGGATPEKEEPEKPADKVKKVLDSIPNHY